LGRTAGATLAERAAALPGDALVDKPQLVTNHGITIDGAAEEVWPWLTQRGWHLGGYYTPAWVDRLLLPANWPSLERLDPPLRRALTARDTPPGRARAAAAHGAVTA